MEKQCISKELYGRVGSPICQKPINFSVSGKQRVHEIPKLELLEVLLLLKNNKQMWVRSILKQEWQKIRKHLHFSFQYYEYGMNDFSSMELECHTIPQPCIYIHHNTYIILLIHILRNINCNFFRILAHYIKRNNFSYNACHTAIFHNSFSEINYANPLFRYVTF